MVSMRCVVVVDQRGTEQVDGIFAGGWPQSFAELLALVCERSGAHRVLEGSQTAESSGDKEIAEMSACERVDGMATGGWPESFAELLARVTEQASTVTKLKSTTSTLPQNNGKFQEQEARRNVYANMDELPEEEEGRKTLKDFFEACKEFIGSDGGPPHWFSPLECGCRAPDSPLLLFLPGIDGTGLGLLMHHQKLGNYKWNQLPNNWFTKTAVPLVDVDPSLQKCFTCLSTSFGKSELKPLLPLLQIIPDEFFLLARNSMLTLTTGDHLRMLMDNVVKGIPLGQSVVGKLSQDIVAASSNPSILVEILPKELLEWKLQMLKSVSAYSNSHLNATKAEVLLLCSGRDQLFPSEEEGERLCHALPNCEIRRWY
ncbi:hypothetical protein SLEP1_g53566 [Rubroshorea leprosula]|uniref:Uncharacterized protein n=1 Tax=Rubroshorea leprosula TaxID=152421 RepID=A0AAV5MCK5_9ROSI|nr:hypothetical protein SLEP1_g53566 [Rubroshorea leprosula]